MKKMSSEPDGELGFGLSLSSLSFFFSGASI